jgi:hypothetical protein
MIIVTDIQHTSQGSQLKESGERMKNNHSLGIGIALGLVFGLLFDNLALGLCIGIAIGVTGVFDREEKKK